MSIVRFGVIGLGNMGGFHVKYLSEGAVENAKLAAICDIDKPKLQKIADERKVPAYATHREMLDSGNVDAVIIATPHYDHPPIALDAFNKDIHVLSEKPAAVSVNAARKLNDAYAATLKRNPKLKYGIMFQSRTSGMYQKLRDVIADGELGEINRITWIASDWFRTWSYYASGGWRATWAGEGGGVLINQCPHNLDLIQWIPGMMPTRVVATVGIGKTHPIEVEDEVSAILQYANGATGHFITTTGEAPGTNRLEIAGDCGKIVAENNKLIFSRNRKSLKVVRETSKESFAWIENWHSEIPFPAGPNDPHQIITRNFTKAVLTDSPMMSPGIEGVRGLEIGNAMLMSGVTQKAVDLPLDGHAYDQMILDLAKKYGGRKTVAAKGDVQTNIAASWK